MVGLIVITSGFALVPSKITCDVDPFFPLFMVNVSGWGRIRPIPRVISIRDRASCSKWFLEVMAV
jgi:hypothetical protein